MRAVDPGWARAAPSANEDPTTGIASAPTRRIGGRDGVADEQRPREAGVSPWLKMITALAPAACALWALSAKLHPPRWMRAIAPAGKPAKSSGPSGSATSGAPTAASVNAPSHPLVLARGGIRLMSTGTTAACDVAESRAGEPARLVGGLHRRELLQLGDAHLVVNGTRSTSQPALLQCLDDVVDARSVARRLVGPRAARWRRRSPATPPGAP